MEAECNVLGMELLNVLEYIGDMIDYRKITLLVQNPTAIIYSSFVGAKIIKFHGFNYKWSE